MPTYLFVGGPMCGQTVETGKGSPHRYRDAQTGEPMSCKKGEAIMRKRDDELDRTLYIRSYSPRSGVYYYRWVSLNPASTYGQSMIEALLNISGLKAAS